jgi:alanyl-tRNA synthetase
VTERLYYNEPYLTEFDARVAESVQTEDGRPAVVLDRTAFYPTSGGQPFDTGTLGSARVVDVIDRDDGRILHVVEGDVGGSEVRGVVDWPRRFDHMQQHTGQHVLSGAFDRLLGARTVSFHLGSASSTIDLDREVPPGEIGLAEAEANTIVWEDRPVTIRFADAEEAARLPLRKESRRSGRLRLIEIEALDLSACGGTHVARTGAIGIILASSWERFRGGTRVEFVCGSRALRDYRRLREAVAGAVRHLSVLPAELPEAVERLQIENREQRRRLKELQGRVAVQHAAELAAAAEPVGEIRLVAAALDGWDAASLKVVAAGVAGRPDHLAVLVAGPAPSTIVVARAANVTVDCAAVLRDVTAAFGGKGGGKADLAQGGGLTGTASDILAQARTAIRAACGTV